MNYKVYVINAETLYDGVALVAAESVVEANIIIAELKNMSNANDLDYLGMQLVSETDRIENVSSSKKGIVYNTISYVGVR